ncbi:MAG TPA: hypothetical protein VK308_14280 [Pyrinomonadaceae bacterium]|nr:hypothetical protein [Pyrinomonadaceae bacterium]
MVLLLNCQFVFSQNGAATVDAVRYFDENKRWYNNFTEHWFYFHDIPEEDIRSSIIYWEQIGEDLKTSVNRGEGTYGNGGETHGSYFRWSEKSGFIWLTVNKCIGGPMKITRGRVSVTPISVKFIPERTVGDSSHHGKHVAEQKEIEFLFVKWREADFLIQPGMLSNFADYTAGLNNATSGIYDEGRYFSKVSQKHVGSANELPIFPAGYEKYVKKPFKATIISIGKSYRRTKPKEVDGDGKAVEQNYDDLVTEVKIDIGKPSGIASDTFIRFLIENDDYTFDGIIVKKVFDKYSIGEYTKDIPKKNCQKSDYENCEAEAGRALKTGQKLTTTGEW